MITETTIRTCNKYQSTRLFKNGTNACGNQQHHCKDCGAYGVVDPHRGYTDEQKERILRAYHERGPRARLHARPPERIFGVSRQTLSK